jgi:lysyl-tRNA synthetase class II
VEKFAELMQSVWLIRNDYERRVRLVIPVSFLRYASAYTDLHELLSAMSDIQSQWATKQFRDTYVDAKEQSAEFTNYKQTTKRTWVTEKQDVTTLFGNVQTKLKTYGLREYVPPHGLALSDLDTAWQRLLDKEAERSREINAQIRMYVIRFTAQGSCLTRFDQDQGVAKEKVCGASE